MILITVATPIEARCIIHTYRLKKRQDTPFQIWENTSYRLIISGMGKTCAAAAVSYLFALSENKIQAIVNFGIAGHLYEKVGEPILVHKIIDEGTQKSGYPGIWFNWRKKSDLLTTFDIPQISYDREGLYDMEGSAFFQTASKFIYTDCIHLLKVVSDNREERTNYLSKEKILSYIEQTISSLSELTDLLKMGSHEMVKDYIPDLTPFLKRWHFTQNQKDQLRSTLTRLEHMDKKIPMENLHFCRHSKQVINVLKEHANSLY